MKKVGIVGASGITGGELLRILRYHPDVKLDFTYSRTHPGKAVSDIHPDILDKNIPKFNDSVNPDVDVVFLCLGHENSKKFLEKYKFSAHTKIIDLSRDFRPGEGEHNKSWIYGLPELNKNSIESCQYLSNPGCFATAIQLALLPLAKNKVLNSDVHIKAITGSTGAGNEMTGTSQFNWRNNNISWYKPFTHQHLGEINATLQNLDENSGELFFLPFRGNFTRGIMVAAYTKFNGSQADAENMFEEFYKDAPFTQLVSEPPHLKQVVNTNFCHLHLLKYKDVLLVTSVLDNLLKGASGQAVQNMNLMLGLDETTALQLKASVY